MSAFGERDRTREIARGELVQGWEQAGFAGDALAPLLEALEARQSLSRTIGEQLLADTVLPALAEVGAEAFALTASGPERDRRIKELRERHHVLLVIVDALRRSGSVADVPARVPKWDVEILANGARR